MTTPTVSAAGRGPAILRLFGIWTLRLLFGAVLVSLFLRTIGPIDRILPWDKAEHFCGALTLLLLAGGGFPRRPVWLFGVLLLAGILVSELSQTALPGRTPDIKDVAAGLLGLATGMAAFAIAGLRDRSHTPVRTSPIG